MTAALTIHLPDVTPEQHALALDAARQTFDAAGVAPQDCARAYDKLERLDLHEDRLTDEDRVLVAIWHEAQHAAAHAIGADDEGAWPLAVLHDSQ